MITINPGHRYILTDFDSKQSGQTLQFVEKATYENLKGTILELNMSQEDRAKYEADPNALILVNDGTTNEEVVEVLINRLYYLQEKFPCRENAIAITHFEEGLMWLNKRTADRIKRNVEGKHIK